jgi:preprotein translocase subunit SecG
MSSPTPNCPCCHSTQAVQCVAAIVSGGTRQVHIVTADLMPAAGVSRSNLTQLLAPPQQPGGSWLPIVALIGLMLLSGPASCMITAVIVGLQGQTFEAAFASGTAERIFLAVAGAAALIAIGLTIGLSQLGERGRRDASDRWNRQMARWQQSWYCHRCHATFVAGTTKAVAPEQFGELLAV